MALINYNFTRLKCTKCGKLFELNPGQEIEEISIKCCVTEPEVAKSKRTRMKKAEADAT